jgi:hypothetical protein
MAPFPTDQFDNLPDSVDRVGAHRGPKVKGRGWIVFAWAVLATGILVIGGLFILSVYDPSVHLSLGGSTAAQSTSGATSTPAPVVTPITDPKTIASRNITITVLNGTATVGLQNTAASKLKAAGWTVGATASSTSTTITTTTVYYSASTNQDAALGIAQLLGSTNVEFSNAFLGSPVTVVVGSDFGK